MPTLDATTATRKGQAVGQVDLVLRVIHTRALPMNKSGNLWVGKPRKEIYPIIVCHLRADKHYFFLMYPIIWAILATDGESSYQAEPMIVKLLLNALATLKPAFSFRPDATSEARAI